MLEPILADGERVWRRFHDIDSEHGAFGAAESHLFEAGDVVDFGITWIEEKLGRAR